MAVADVYDALVSRRIYKEGMPHDRAFEILLEGRGSHFDPDVVDAFVAIGDEIRAIAALFLDNEAALAAKAASQSRISGSTAETR